MVQIDTLHTVVHLWSTSWNVPVTDTNVHESLEIDNRVTTVTDSIMVNHSVGNLRVFA